MVDLHLCHSQGNMAGQINRILSVLVFICFSLVSFSAEYLKVQAKPGDGISVLLNRYNLASFECNIDTFLKVNELDRKDHLQLAKTYRLPILVYDYNDVSIRTTIDNSNYQLAVYIQRFNEDMHEAGLREYDYRTDKQLWVPIHALNCVSESDLQRLELKKEEIEQKTPIISAEDLEIEVSDENDSENKVLRTENFPIFGEKYAKTPIYSEQLKGQVYYLISGHGGPDPGAMTHKDGHPLCEDEYAYDISLRLARNLLQHGATVYVITRDEDGIRDTEFLPVDHDETVWYNQPIPRNHRRRLSQRSDKVNELYEKHRREGATIQRVVEIHIDSRYEKQKVDIFFYYYPGSQTGKDLATEMYRTIKTEYDEHQKGRGYRGVVKSRDLHTLRECKPPVVYIELGNITNEFDQKRLLVVNNRQAIANWLALGILSKNKLY